MNGSDRLDSLDDRRRLLRVVRDTASAILCGGEQPSPATPIPGRFGGAFVTFWNGKRLRGCVGSFAPTTDIVVTIQNVTRSSLNDSRFASDPITADELDELNIEVSLLTDPKRTSDPLSLVAGVDGVVVRQGERSGCFLPKVASERGWTSEEFLANCCTMKAGLPADAWRDERTEVLLFRAEVFSDADVR